MRGGVIGIDPGVSGAAAFFRPAATPASGIRWDVIDLPTVGEKPHLDFAALRDWFRRWDPEHAFLERVNAMPSIGPERRGMGATSAFRFGGAWYGIQAVLACCDIPFTLVTPQMWKKAAGLLKSDKEASRQRALQLFPDQAHTLRRRMDQNRADAMHLAAYGARVWTPIAACG